MYRRSPTSDASDTEVSADEVPDDNEALSHWLVPQTSTGSKPRNRQKKSGERQEKIDQALAKMIAVNQLPLAFATSTGFKHFMDVVEPSYKTPSYVNT